MVREKIIYTKIKKIRLLSPMYTSVLYCVKIMVTTFSFLIWIFTIHHYVGHFTHYDTLQYLYFKYFIKLHCPIFQQKSLNYYYSDKNITLSLKEVMKNYLKYFTPKNSEETDCLSK